MTESKTRLEKTMLTMTSVVVVYTCMSALINISFGVDSAQMVRAFDLDEQLIMRILSHNFTNNVLTCGGIFEHGITYQAIALVVTKSLAGLGYLVSDRLLILVLRILSLFAFILMLAVAYLLMRRLDNNRIISLLAASFLASMPELLRYAGTAHPDTLQLLLIVCAFTIAISSHFFAPAFLAASVCGFAMATKMGSLTLLPFLILPAAMHYLAEIEGPRLTFNNGRHLAVCFLLTIVSFLTSFFIAFPQALSSDFVARMRLLSSSALSGVEKAQESANPFLWLPVIAEQYSTMGMLLMLIGIAAIVVMLLRSLKQADTLQQGVVDLIGTGVNRSILSIVAFVGCSCVFLVLVKWRAARHIFPFLVFVSVLGFTGIGYLTASLTKQWQRALVYVLVLVTVGINACSSVKMLSYMAGKYESPTVAASQWIVQKYGFNVPLLGDSYTYIPPEMTTAAIESNFVASRLSRTLSSGATLITLSRAASGRFAWMKKGTRIHDGQIEVYPGVNPDTASEFERFLKDVSSNRSDWKVVYESEEILVLEDANRLKRGN